MRTATEKHEKNAFFSSVTTINQYYPISTQLYKDERNSTSIYSPSFFFSNVALISAVIGTQGRQEGLI